MKTITGLSIQQIRNGLKRKDFSIQEVSEAFLNQIEEIDQKIGAFLTVDRERVLADAREMDQKLSRGELKLSQLTGIPIAVKDNIITQGVRTTCASQILHNYIPPYESTVVGKLRRNGAIVIGKTNCDEFAMGSSTENSSFQITRNPWDLTRVPGGSSGGSAAAVAASMVPGALGSDTGGSIRQPAAFCGVVGMKPTYGRISRYGLVAFGSSLDQIGPITRNARDTAAILQVIAGRDSRDSTSAEQPVGNYIAEIGKDVHQLRVGVPREWISSGLDPEVRRQIEAAVSRIGSLGCEVEEIELPHTEHAIATYYIIAPAEASSNLARYDGVRYGYRSHDHVDLDEMYRKSRSEGFGEEVKRRIMIGTYVLSSGYYDAYYLKAGKVRNLIRQDYLKAFEKVDLIAGPVTPTPPFTIGEKVQDPLSMYLSDIFTVTANLAGIPGLSLPCGYSDEGLPIGIQILGPQFEEGRILRMAHALESTFIIRKPDLTRES
jgi:aspartyl-tRNA(Asn)/glutamyl-tRNA(Gln) amidotransferase subunit A